MSSLRLFQNIFRGVPQSSLMVPFFLKVSLKYFFLLYHADIANHADDNIQNAIGNCLK